MADFMNQSQRSAHMAKIRSKNTKPEIKLRRMLHAAGYRYRLHSQALPGRPDLVFRSRKKVIFINGCFWHGHDCPAGQRLPKSNTEFWEAKRQRNQERDARQRSELAAMGWAYLDVWECVVKDEENLLTDVSRFLAR